MPLVIPDETLRDAGLTEAEMKVEIACRLFDAGRLTKHQAAKLAALTRDEFQAALYERGLDVYHISDQAVREDMETIAKLFGRDGNGRS